MPQIITKDGRLHLALQCLEVSTRPCAGSRGHDLQVSHGRIQTQALLADYFSHIFCEECAASFGLAAASTTSRVCPACQTQLINPDDVAVTHLDPADDYKTSILSGLSPPVIMECAARGMAFWNYQITQEV